MLAWLVRGAAMLALAEMVLAGAVGFRFFLSAAELGRYALVAWSNTTLWVVAAGTALSVLRSDVARQGDLERRQRRIMGWTIGIGVPLLSWLFWALSAGRRVRDLPARGLTVVVLAALVAFAASRVLFRVHAAHDDASAHKRWSWALAASALVALAINGTVLRRLYAPFHLGLSVMSVVLVAQVALSCSGKRAVSARLSSLGGVLFVLACLALPLSSTWLTRAPNGRFAVAHAAPISGLWIEGWSRLMHRPTIDAPLPASNTAPSSDAVAQVGISLRGHDVLLITIDALRADRLRAYGGEGLTPNMDRLAAESVVFTHAYTPTPHTSYALTSMLTGKFMRPVLDLPSASTDHRTLPEMLRRYGYRTAAFFPPAVFFVDAERFASLSRNDFGFEYRKVMFASAQDRVKQVQHYLSRAEANRPVFLWVHLFEPHEPYAPSEAFARGDSAEQRYDGEVVQADDGVGGLVRVFRAARPRSTVIVTADHGEEFDDHGGRFHGTTLFDEQVRVPLVWSSVGVAARSVKAPVETVDIATTLLSALGIPRDARMRGDNLGAALGGAVEGSPQLAFADINDARMVTDGTHKLICHADDNGCLLFDLAADPRETRNLVSERADVAERLRREIGAFIGSIPSVEAMALADGVGWPQALARGRLGDRTVGPELVPLLGSQAPLWRAGAARACGELQYKPALQVIDALRANDPDLSVRAEAALAALALGATQATTDVIAVASNPASARDLRSRAALLLAAHNDASASAVLIESAGDAHAAEGERVAAIEALGTLKVVQAVPVLVGLLADVRLRPLAARALGAIGGSAARRALLAALEEERYPSARAAEAHALIVLHEPRVRGLLQRFLGTDTSVPGGVMLLDGVGALSPPSPSGARLNEARAWHDERLTCDVHSCWPMRGQVPSQALASAELRLPPAMTRAARRVTLALTVEKPEAKIVLDGTAFEVAPGAQQVSIVLEASRTGHALQVSATEGVRLVAMVAVPPTEDVPPPPPEPFVVPSLPPSSQGQPSSQAVP